MSASLLRIPPHRQIAINRQIKRTVNQRERQQMIVIMEMDLTWTTIVMQITSKT